MNTEPADLESEALPIAPQGPFKDDKCGLSSYAQQAIRVRLPIKFKRFPCRESNPGHGGENARSSPLDHMGILGYGDIQFPSMKAGRRCTFIAKIIGEFNFRNILRWRGIEPRSPAWQARILPLNHQRHRSFIPTIQSFESDISV